MAVKDRRKDCTTNVRLAFNTNRCMPRSSLQCFVHVKRVKFGQDGCGRPRSENLPRALFSALLDSRLFAKGLAGSKPCLSLALSYLFRVSRWDRLSEFLVLIFFGIEARFEVVDRLGATLSALSPWVHLACLPFASLIRLVTCRRSGCGKSFTSSALSRSQSCSDRCPCRKCRMQNDTGPGQKCLVHHQLARDGVQNAKLSVEKWSNRKKEGELKLNHRLGPCRRHFVCISANSRCWLPFHLSSENKKAVLIDGEQGEGGGERSKEGERARGRERIGFFLDFGRGLERMHEEREVFLAQSSD